MTQEISILFYSIFVFRPIKKNPAKQDSPPAAGRFSDIIPFRRSAHLCKLCLLLWNREFYRNFLFHKQKTQELFNSWV